MGIDFLSPVIEASKREMREGDYVDEAGFVCCGKCHTRRQRKLTHVAAGQIVWMMCRCETEAWEREQAEQRERDRREQIQRLRSVGFPDREMARYTFARDDGANPELTKLCRNYAEQFDRFKREGKGLLLFGGVGAGKTFMACCVANRLIDRGHSCLVTNFTRIANALNGLRGDKQAYLDDLARYELLVIDDLAVERDTAFMSEMVQTVIDARVRQGLPMIVTTNLSAEALKNPADVRSQRVCSRLIGACFPYEVKGPDRRKESLKKSFADLKAALLEQ